MRIGLLLNHQFPPIGARVSFAPLPTDFAVMLVGTLARQAASPTAVYFQSQVAPTAYDATILGPAHGAFNLTMAHCVRRWKET